MHNKKKYRRLCREESSIPIFSRDWWLDMVCGADNWNVAIAEQKDVICGAMPYYFRNTYAHRLLTMPPLTQKLGPWIRLKRAKYCQQLSYTNKVMNSLLAQLPKFHYFRQNWDYENTNWLPFYWKGFQQTTSYTYVLEDLSDLDSVWKGFDAKLRNIIRKAQKKSGLVVRKDIGIEDFFQINAKTFAQRQMHLPYDASLLGRLDRVCDARKCRKILAAEDKCGNLHAAVYIVWDKISAYYLMGGYNPEFAKSNATSLVLWDAINFAATRTQRFDFEGSMNPGIEGFFRQFGGKQKAFMTLTKSNSSLIDVYFLLRKLVSQKCTTKF